MFVTSEFWLFSNFLSASSEIFFVSEIAFPIYNINVKFFFLTYNIYMSLFIQSTTGPAGTTIDRGAGIYGVNPSPYQIEKENSFNPSTAVPGQKNDLHLSTVSKDIFRNKNMNVVFTCNTSDPDIQEYHCLQQEIVTDL